MGVRYLSTREGWWWPKGSVYPLWALLSDLFSVCFLSLCLASDLLSSHILSSCYMFYCHLCFCFTFPRSFPSLFDFYPSLYKVDFTWYLEGCICGGSIEKHLYNSKGTHIDHTARLVTLHTCLHASSMGNVDSPFSSTRSGLLQYLDLHQSTN